MPSARHIAAPLALLGALVGGGPLACADPPSFELRWTVGGEPLTRVATCADSGLFHMRVRTYAASGVLAEERVYPCFPDAFEDENGLVAGPTLDPGLYAIELRGIDRAFEPWDDEPDPSLDPDEVTPGGCRPGDDTPQCRPHERVCDCRSLVVLEQDGSAPASDAVVTEAGQTASEPLEFDLDPPRPCEDGIDNDRDGRVDARDPSCLLETDDIESLDEGTPVGITDFEISVTLLGGNPAALCSSVPQFGRVQLRLEREGMEPLVLFEAPCQLDAPYRFSRLLDVGPATFSVIGIDSRPGQESQPSTLPFVFEQELTAQGNLVRRSIDFSPADFLQPIEGRMLFSFSYHRSLGAGINPRSSCSLGPEQGLLDIDGLRLTMRNAHGGPVEPPVRLTDGTPLDGSTVLPCVGANLLTEVVDWTDGYRLNVEALSAEGEVCFYREGAPMRPEEPLTLALPWAYDPEGGIAPSCHDCEVDGDCHPDDDRWRCIDHTCQYPCEEDLDCQPPALGDAFACLDLGDDRFCLRP